MKINQSSIPIEVSVMRSLCTHFIIIYYFKKGLKYVDASPTAAVYDNPGRMCGFVVTRPVLLHNLYYQSYYTIAKYILFIYIRT